MVASHLIAPRKSSTRGVEHVTGIEPVSPPWQGGVIAVIRYVRFLKAGKLISEECGVFNIFLMHNRLADFCIFFAFKLYVDRAVVGAENVVEDSRILQ